MEIFIWDPWEVAVAVVKMTRPRVKITVLKRVDPSVIFDGDVPNMPGTDKKYTICTRFEDGQEFVSESGEQPDGFCSWAWADIQRDVTMMRLGGARDWLKQEGTWLSSCTDGMKPVIFLLERLGNGEGGTR